MRIANSATSGDEKGWRRLLVVDDEEIVLVALRETLMRAGYEVFATNDAASALEALRTTRFAVIITDQQMPRMTGLEFLAQAKELRPEATRILITAVLNLGTVIEAINQGEIYRFIMKPWLREEFLGAVTSAVERYRLVSGHTELRSLAETAVQERDALSVRVKGLSDELELKERQLDVARRRAFEERDRVRALAHWVVSGYDRELGDRTRRVAAVCRALGETARLTESERTALEDAGWYHDLGCLRVEGTVYEEHPRKGGELAAALGLGVEVRAAIEVHHERQDGSGTPLGLSGEAIPWLGRLLAVAVAYVEGGADREAALAGVRNGAGTKFDPEAVRFVERAVAGMEPADAQG